MIRNARPRVRTSTGARNIFPRGHADRAACLRWLSISCRIIVLGVEPLVEVCHVTVHDWYHRLEHLFDPDRDRRQAVAVDETKLEIEDEEVYVWAAVDVDTFELLHVDVSPGRSSLDALLFLTEVLKYCRGHRLCWLTAASGTTGHSISPSANRSKKSGEIAHSSKHGSVCSDSELCCSDITFPTTVAENQPEAGSNLSLHSTIPCPEVNTLGYITTFLWIQ